MATDDHGRGIPVPDEHTKDFELYALVRDAINTIAAQLVQLDKPREAAALQLPAEIEQRIVALESRPQPEPLDLEPITRSIADLKLSLIQPQRTTPDA